ncbi:unnamed protein product [Cuscuta campestris]|uniref:Uncharacterized protein n=1 Tax=Cuscuta campestris TaxID=132261 RepID=A0A484NH45_9ASTE|nr:unnamed protein product [Cuscuta campestris]
MDFFLSMPLKLPFDDKPAAGISIQQSDAFLQHLTISGDEEETQASWLPHSDDRRSTSTEPLTALEKWGKDLDRVPKSDLRASSIPHTVTPPSEEIIVAVKGEKPISKGALAWAPSHVEHARPLTASPVAGPEI